MGGAPHRGVFVVVDKRWITPRLPLNQYSTAFFTLKTRWLKVVGLNRF
jgi:hypothetical protein